VTALVRYTSPGTPTWVSTIATRLRGPARTTDRGLDSRGEVGLSETNTRWIGWSTVVSAGMRMNAPSSVRAALSAVKAW
jgi:hypothetical protein